METLEQLDDRLENLESVTPMLSALRLIALGSWQATKKNRRHLVLYTAHLGEILTSLAPFLAQEEVDGGADHVGTAVLAIGTERGLVGRFSEGVAARLEVFLGQQAGPVELTVLGSRLKRLLEPKGTPIKRFAPLPGGGLPPTGLARDLAADWWQGYIDGRLSGLTLIYNETKGIKTASSVVEKLLPPSFALTSGKASVPWPPPIIETAPQSMAQVTARLWMQASVYRALLIAAEAEHVTRYQLMEAAVQNAERLSEELTTELRSARQEAITREMQELTAGADMLSTHTR